MASIFPLTQELAANYTMTSPAGDIANFNNTLASYYVGPITNITGLDGPEVVESSGMNVERDGGFNNNFFLGRRPFTLTGEIVPTSPINRASKLSILKAASLALQEDGTLLWTPQEGQPVYLNFRLAQPLIISGAWIKQWFFTGIAADPRIYSKLTYSTYLGLNSTSEDVNYRFTYASGVAKQVGTMKASFVAGRNVKFLVWMRVNSTWSGGTPTVKVTGITGTNTVKVGFNIAEKNVWQLVQVEFAPTASGEGTLSFTSEGVPAVGNTLDVSMPIVVAEEDFPTLLGTSTSYAISAEAGWTKSSLTERPEFNLFQEGNYEAPTVAEIHGPITGFHLVNSSGLGTSEVVVSGISLAEGQVLVIDLDKRTVTHNAEDLYGSVKFSETQWWGVRSMLPPGSQTVRLKNVTGANANTGARITYRNTWY